MLLVGLMKKVAIIVLIAAIASTAFADTPRGAWIKAKCAVCHGEDGSSNTPEGRRRNAPDLRSAEVQKRNDAELFDIIARGHGKMPSFNSLSQQQIAMLVIYIRSLRK